MKILVVGPGVIGATYAWQLAESGEDVTVMVRPGKREQVATKGITLYCKDEREGQREPIKSVFCPTVVDDFSRTDGYALIIVAVRSNQLAPLLPLLCDKAGKADILFFQNNWWDDRITNQLLSSQYLFGFPRLVGGWRNEQNIECTIFDGPGQVTLLGEKDGKTSLRLEWIRDLFAKARLKPKINRNILGWLITHYVEYIGPIGVILQAGSTKSFAEDSRLVRRALLATREGLAVCRARGIRVGRVAPMNLRLLSIPLPLVVPFARMSYGAEQMQQFLADKIAHGMDEVSGQYYDVLSEGKRLGVKMPVLESLEPYYHNFLYS